MRTRLGPWIKRLLGAGLLAGVGFALWRLLEQRSRESALEWHSAPFPNPPRPVPREEAAPGGDGSKPGAAWVEPDGDRCPASHPIKGKQSSGIYHPPDGRLYDRTIPDRCYRDPAAAEADGLRASKR